ncbi:PucR family transcriptional regulator [Sciscionella marina]|uniref:PucR family transcriptional regulator n=1 Tax=Sciscionella marina TaxID=508770 RepID=UPI0003692032|nr:PucR family transcriptional regulator [Sciscionella marina]
MGPTVNVLLDHPALGLNLRAGHACEQRISWVHVSELLDPTPFLGGGELLLTTGLTLPADEQEQAEYIARLAGAGVAGLGFGVELGHDQIPEGLIAAADRAGLALFEVPHRTPFIEISKTIAQWLTEETDRESLRAERARQALIRTALRADGLSGLATELAKHLDCWAVFLDATGQSVGAEPATATGRLGPLTEQLRRLRTARAPAGMSLTVETETIAAQSLGSGAYPVGFLITGRRTAFNPTDQHILHIAAALLSVALCTTSPVADARVRTVALQLLLDGRADLCAELGVPAPPDELVVLACTGYTESFVRDCHAAGMFTAELEDALIVLAPAERRPPSARHIGVSAAAGPSGIAEAYRQARTALRASIRHGTAVTRFTELGLGIFAQLPDISTEAALRPLVEHDQTQRGDLLGSLRTWLTCHGQWEQAANRLGVHRHTLRNRIEKAEVLLDRSLDSPDIRAELWFALRRHEERSNLSNPAGEGTPNR